MILTDLLESYVSAAEKKTRPGIKVGGKVLIKFPKTQFMVSFGVLERIGPSGLGHIKLNSPMEVTDPDMPDYFNGLTKIAVPMSWLYPDMDSAFPQPKWKKPDQATKELPFTTESASFDTKK